MAGNRTKSKAWFYHDADARRDPKLIYLKEKGGHEFKGIWWDLIEYLREVDDYRVASNIAIPVIKSLGTSAEIAQEFLKTCLDCSLLIEKENLIFSPSLIERQSHYDAICEKNKANAKRPLSGRRAKRQRAIPIPILDPNPFPNPKEGVQGEVTFPVETPPLCMDALKRWAAHMLSKHKRDFGQQQIDATLLSYSLREDELIENINHSIMSGYRSIYPKPSENGTAKKSGKNFQDASDLAKKYRSEGR